MNRTRATLLLTLILWIAIPMPPALAHEDLVSAIPSKNAHLTSIPYLEASFWKNYESRILLGTAFLIAFLIWLRFKYLENSRREISGAREKS